MNKYILVFIGLFGLLFSHQLAAQELDATVRIEVQGDGVSDRRITKEMEKEFSNFLNNKKWTNDNFDRKERIKCNFSINITGSPSVGQYEATVQVQSTRPVYGSGYESTLLNFADRDWSFEYIESQPMNFNPNNYQGAQSEIAFLLAYYVYIVLGYDYDSFSELGGAPHFNRAQQIVQAAAGSNSEGWDQFSGATGRNRFSLMQDMINPQIEPVRIANYTYHRQGLDLMTEKEEEGRQGVLSAVESIQPVSKLFPQSIAVIAFLETKQEELVSIFTKGEMPVRQKAYNALVEIDPSQTDAYSTMLQD